MSWKFSTPDLISAIDQDISCADDSECTTIDLGVGESSAQSFGFESSPIYANWYAVTVRVRASVTGGGAQIATDVTIGSETFLGTFQDMTNGVFVNYQVVFTGTFDNVDIDGITANVRFQNVDASNTATVTVSGVDIVAEGSPTAMQEIKIVPLYEVQSYGTHSGTITDLYEGLEWPRDASQNPDLPLVPAGAFTTSPDPLPKPWVSAKQGDQDYEAFPLTSDQRSSAIEYGFSDPTPPSSPEYYPGTIDPHESGSRFGSQPPGRRPVSDYLSCRGNILSHQ